MSKTDVGDIEMLGEELRAKMVRVLGRSMAIREVDAGSCNACEVEVNSLTNSVYDIERFGLHIVASPRHADALLVTGPVTRNMEVPLLKTYEAAPNPRIVIAMGSCAISGGMFRDCYACHKGVSEILPVDVLIPGCPPRPQAIIQGIMIALEKMDSRKRGGSCQK
jgi:Ni,Fe-hydrogenase III small subunit